jgi:hypothetical protein
MGDGIFRALKAPSTSKICAEESRVPRSFSLKPSTLVRYPPAKYEQRQGERQTPPDGQSDIQDQAEDDEEQPEDLLFHSALNILRNSRKNFATDWITVIARHRRHRP